MIEVEEKSEIQTPGAREKKETPTLDSYGETHDEKRADSSPEAEACSSISTLY